MNELPAPAVSQIRPRVHETRELGRPRGGRRRARWARGGLRARARRRNARVTAGGVACCDERRTHADIEFRPLRWRRRRVARVEKLRQVCVSRSLARLLASSSPLRARASRPPPAVAAARRDEVALDAIQEPRPPEHVSLLREPVPHAQLGARRQPLRRRRPPTRPRPPPPSSATPSASRSRPPSSPSRTPDPSRRRPRRSGPPSSSCTAPPTSRARRPPPGRSIIQSEVGVEFKGVS